jgi:hypothetical protein
MSRHLFENEEETGADYLLMDKEYVLTPVDTTAEELIKAFDNKDNYGRYVSSMRSAKVTDKDLEDYFGPRSPRLKASKEAERGAPFPVKTPQAIQDFIKSKVGKPNLVHPELEGDVVVFPKAKNPTRGETKNIIQTVLDNAGIKYKIKQRATIDEAKKAKLKAFLKEEILKVYKK